jgi:hypothetical protein
LELFSFLLYILLIINFYKFLEIVINKYLYVNSLSDYVTY